MAEQNAEQDSKSDVRAVHESGSALDVGLPTTIELPAHQSSVLASSLLLISDVLMLGLSLALAMILRQALPLGSLEPGPVFSTLPLYALFVAVYAYSGLYPSFGMTAIEEFRRITHANVVICLGLGAALFLARIEDVSRLVFLTSSLFAVALVPAGRGFLRGWCSRSVWWGYPVVVIGQAKRAAGLIRAMRVRPEIGLRPVAVIGPDVEVGRLIQGIMGYGKIDEAGPKLSQAGIHKAVLAAPDLSRGRVSDMVMASQEFFERVTVVPDLVRFTHLHMTPREYGGLLGLEFSKPLNDPTAKLAKRTIDLVLVTLAMPFLLPLGALIALAIRLTSPGPVFFIQERLGINGGRFKMYKFRTMYVDAEKRLAEVLDSDEAMAQEYRRMHKLKNDPRVTSVGWFLRRSSLDELPQLLNVFFGDMSLVGPRPYLPSELPEIGGMERVFLQVRPGLTGYWQVFDRNHATFHRRLLMDVHYVRNWSIWMDVYLLLRTLDVVLIPRRAH